MAWWAACMLAAAAAAGAAYAEAISVRAEVDQRQVPVNGQVQLSVNVSGTQRVDPPDLQLKDFDAQYLGPSTQVSIINGMMSSSVAHTYVLIPRAEGTFTIDPIEVMVDGQAYRTAPITIQVVPAASVVTRGPGGPGASDAPQILGDQLQLQLGADRTTAYVNQAIPVRIQLLVGGVAVRGIERPVLPADGFLVTPFGQPTQSRVDAGGQSYTLLEFSTTLVPLRPGALTIGPATLRCQVAVRSPRHPAPGLFGNHPLFDEFFGGSSVMEATVRSEPLPVAVLPLPDEGKPVEFAGAVGQFQLDVTVTPQDITAGEPVTLTMTVDGTGNPDAITAPVLALDPSRFKVYPTTLRQDAGIPPSRRVFEQVVIPTEASVTDIPPVRFAFFDPEAAQYRTLTRGPFPLRVAPASAAAQPVVVSGSVSGPTWTQAESLGRDIIYIKDSLGPRAPDRPWYQSWASLAALLGPFIVLAASGLAHRAYTRWAVDPGLARASGAFTRAMAQVQRARGLERDGRAADCSAELFRALQRYIGDRFNLPSEGFTTAELERHLRPRGMPEELLRDLVQWCGWCDAARFAPAASATGQTAATLAQAEALLQRMERWRPA